MESTRPRLHPSPSKAPEDPDPGSGDPVDPDRTESPATRTSPASRPPLLDCTTRAAGPSPSWPRGCLGVVGWPWRSCARAGRQTSGGGYACDASLTRTGHVAKAGRASRGVTPAPQADRGPRAHADERSQRLLGPDERHLHVPPHRGRHPPDYLVHVPPAAAPGCRSPWSSTSTAPPRTAGCRSSPRGWTPPPTRRLSGGLSRRHQDVQVLTPDPVAKQAQYAWNAGAVLRAAGDPPHR